jgi:signal transduction histidine kinase
MALRGNVRIVVATGLPHVFGDPARLELAVLNLVSNGIKYSDPEKAESFVEIGPGTNRDAVANGMYAIQVRDNGLGIAEADRSSIFERFFRAHTHLDATLGVTGSGLGLAIAADCVRAMGGSIDCDSVVRQGTCFVVTLPMTPPDAHAVNPADPLQTDK